MFDPFRDPGNETKVGGQADRETDAGAFSSRPAPWSLGDRLGDFILEAELGSGSSAWVYRVRDTHANNRTLALKLLRPESPEKMLWNKQGFRRMISVDHPALVRVELIHQLGDYVGLAMEEVRGRTLSKARRDLLNVSPTVAYEQVLSLLRQFASGLAVMHAHGLIHRDLKPANMMVEDGGNAKIIDYGLVDKFGMTPLDCTPRGRILGTSRYIAPEVLWSQQYLPSGDIFCLGVVFLETLLGIQANAGLLLPEFERSKEDDEDQQRINDAIEDIKDAVPSFIIDTCKQMLSREPADRPQATELARLGQSESVSVVLPRPDPVVGRQVELKQMTDWADTIFSGAVGRLHVRGPSGIGKSFLTDQLSEYIESKHWGQLFRAKCRKREDQPMQAIDQLCDAIAERYMQSDRDPIMIDPVSARILRDGFPVLANVLSKEIVFPPIRDNNSDEALVAAVRLTEQLRLVGPLFLLIDDAQWADQASRVTLDRLAKSKGPEGLGIISISRGENVFRVPAQRTVQLDRLTDQESVSFLSQYAQQWNVQVAPTTLEALAAAADGSPLQLRALASEFRPGRGLAAARQSLDEVALDRKSIHSIWNSRVKQLSDDARAVLPYVLTGGGRMSTKQLGELSGLWESIDAAVSELAQQCLIRDEATGGECIQILHDRVADVLLPALSPEEKQSAHLAWASHLARQHHAQQSAARIAGHFFAAGQPGQALSHAILAAEDAEKRSAIYEAAMLYERVSEHVQGAEKIYQLRNAARCYRLAQHSVEAANCYRQLATLVDQNERVECHFEAAALLTRAGHIDEVHRLLRDVASEMRLPKRKPNWLACPAAIVQLVKLQIASRGNVFAKLIDGIGDQNETASAIDRQTEHRLDLCLSLVPPLSFFDHLYSAELFYFGTRLLQKHACTESRIQAAASYAVQSCYDNRPARQAGERQLRELREIAEIHGDARCKGDAEAGIAISHGLAGRWQSVFEPAERGAQFYSSLTDPYGFILAHTKWMNQWAMWYVGRWHDMKEHCMSMYYESARHNDRFYQMVAHNGFSVAAWLAEDNLSSLDRIQRDTSVLGGCLTGFQLIDFFKWIGSTLRKVYEGDYDQAWNDFQAIRPNLRKHPFRDLQLARIVWKQLGTLIAIHRLNQSNAEPDASRVTGMIDQLRDEQTPFACMLADLYSGLLERTIAQIQGNSNRDTSALRSLNAARDSASAQDLIPFQLVASDAIAEIESGAPSNLFNDHMRDEQIVRPDRFRRLFTIDSL